MAALAAADERTESPADRAFDSGRVEIAILGAGVSGLGMAIRLREAGIDDFVVIERADAVGGTWQANTYPGCACDVPSRLYSFSFAPNPNWTHTYSRQPEIKEYLREVADRFDVRPHIRLGCELSGAQWDPEHRRWDLTTSAGELRARILISATGILVEPRLPEIEGIERFAGTTFHSARWDHDYDLTGKRVAVIGTGASAIQFVPEIQPLVAQLHVFQRTAPWVLPHPGRPTTDRERAVLGRFPALGLALRLWVYLRLELLLLGFAKNRKFMAILEGPARKQLEAQVPDPELRERVTPQFSIGCKRVLPSSEWYPAIGRPNVELVTDEIAEITPRGVRTTDGTEREVDAIIFGTGFSVTEVPISAHIRDAEGVTLSERSGGAPKAHLGATFAGFPNLFMILGPNTTLGHSSMIYMAESQIAYVLDAVRTMRERELDAVEVRPEALTRSNDEIDELMRDTVWSSGCSSWYIDRTGRISALWPDWTWRFRQRTARFDAANYRVPARVASDVARRRS